MFAAAATKLFKVIGEGNQACIANFWSDEVSDFSKQISLKYPLLVNYVKKGRYK